MFIELIAISGEFPTDSIELILGTGRYKEKIITQLKSKKLIKLRYKDGIRSYKITLPCKKILLEENYNRFKFYLSGNVETNTTKSELSRRIRLHRIAETYALMKLSNVFIFRDEKNNIFELNNPENIKQILLPSFYNSREIKELGIEAVKVKNSRCVGVLITTKDIYIIYNTNLSIMKWEYKSEMRMKAVIDYCINNTYKNIYTLNNIKAIMIGKNMDIAFSLLTSNGGIKNSLFKIDNSFDCFYFIPLNEKGIILLKILCNKNLQLEINQLLITDLNQRYNNSIDCDAYDNNNNPVLLAYLFDMNRISKFNSIIELRNMAGVIICFDFQLQTLEKFCCNNITFQTISFEKFEKRFFNG